MRYRHLFLGLLTANAASLLLLYGCELQSGGTATGPGVDGGRDTQPDGPGNLCPDGAPTCEDAGPSPCEQDRNQEMCKPVKLAPIPGATDLAIDSTGAVVTVFEPAAVYYVPLPADGSVPGTWIPVQGTTTKPSGPSIDANGLYWVEVTGNGRVMRAPRDGSAMTVLVGEPPSTVQPSPESTALDSTNLYWLNYERGAIGRVPSAGGGVTGVVPQGEFGSTWRALVADQSGLFWARESGLVQTLPSDGGAVVSVGVAGVGAGTVLSMALAPNGNLYLAASKTTPGQPSIFRLSKSAIEAHAEAIVAKRLEEPRIAVDNQYVYYTEPKEGTIWRLRLDAPVVDGGVGTAPVPLFQSQGTPTGIRVDAKYIYWVNNAADGGLMRALK